jgi:AraC-like DNA-binding protein
MVLLDDLENAGLAQLGRRLGEQRSWAKRFMLAEEFVRARLVRGRPVSPAVDWAYRRIVSAGGAVPISAIATELGWSRKHLAVRFREQIGSAPKSVARIARFNRATALARQDHVSGWADIAAVCGYADQAHLVREFKEFAGVPPATWRARPG